MSGITKMSISEDDIKSILFNNLTSKEIARSIVYIADNPVPTGTCLRFPRTQIDIPWDAFLAFIDSDPTANWSHSCRYVLLNCKTGEIRSFDAQFPPFRQDQQMHWRVAYKAKSVPDAAVVTK